MNWQALLKPSLRRLDEADMPFLAMLHLRELAVLKIRRELDVHPLVKERLIANSEEAVKLTGDAMRGKGKRNWSDFCSLDDGVRLSYNDLKTLQWGKPICSI